MTLLNLDSFVHHQRSDAISEPMPETVIWKYLDFAKYLALLKTRCLHLAPTTEFSDRHEGDIGQVQKQALIQKYGQAKYDEVMELLQLLRERTYVSCWTENEFESDAMWKIYTGASYGVAICSTYGRLRSLLPNDDRRVLRFCGKVNYIDFKSQLFDLDNYSLPYFYKRRSFEHEREVRMIVQDLESVRNRTTGAPAFRKIQLSREQLNDLIMSVHLSPGAPGWFKSLVYDVNRDYGLECEPHPSSLDV